MFPCLSPRGDGDESDHSETMTKQCAARSCTEGTTGYSTLCDNHKHIQRRHGHPEQDGITVHRLKPYLKRVEARRAKNIDSAAWSILEARWGALQGHAQSILAEWSTGKAMVGMPGQRLEGQLQVAGLRAEGLAEGVAAREHRAWGLVAQPELVKPVTEPILRSIACVPLVRPEGREQAASADFLRPLQVAPPAHRGTRAGMPCAAQWPHDWSTLPPPD